MASRSLGTLTLDLVAKIGGYVSGLDRADRAADKFAKDQEKRFKEMNVSAIAAGTAIGEFLADGIRRAAAAFPALVDALDQFNDVKDATGSSVENISALDRVARETGTTLENVEGVLVKFNAALKEAKPDNDAGRVFAQLNLNIAELKSLDPAEALRRTAVAFSQFTDDGNKARAMQELFGKSVRDAAPFLNDLAEKTELVGTTSAAAAQQAETFNKQVFALKADITDLARALTSELIPALSRVITNIREFKSQGNLGLIFKDAAKDIVGFGKLTDDAGKDINNFMKERERLQKNLAFAESKGRPTAAIQDEIKEINKYLQVARTRQKTLADQTSATEDYTDAVSRRFAADKKSLSLAEDPKKKPGGGGGGSTKAAIDESARYIEQLQKQLERTQELTVQEQALQDIQMGRLGQVTEAQKEQILSTAAQIDALKEQKKQEEKTKKYQEALADVNSRLAEMKGLTSEAAGIKFDRENSALYTIFSEQGDAEAKKKLDTMRQMTVAAAQFAEQQEKVGKVQSDLQRKEERISRDMELGIAGQIDGLMKLGEARKSALEGMKLALTELQAIEANGVALTARQKDQVEELKNEIEDLSTRLDPLAEKFNEMFADKFTTAFESIIDGSKSVKAALKDMVNSFVSDLVKLAAQDVFKSLVSGGGSSTGGQGFNVGSLLSSLFSGQGFMSGGFTGYGAANDPAGIVHKGEYVLDAQTTRHIGVDNLNKGNFGGMTVNFAIEGQVDRRTQTQVAQEVRRQTNTASRRFG